MGKDEACARGCFKVLETARLFDGDARVDPSEEPTLDDPTRPDACS